MVAKSQSNCDIKEFGNSRIFLQNMLTFSFCCFGASSTRPLVKDVNDAKPEFNCATLCALNSVDTIHFYQHKPVENYSPLLKTMKSKNLGQVRVWLELNFLRASTLNSNLTLIMEFHKIINQD